MQILRLIMWVAITAIAVAFIVMNWGEAHEVKIWPGEGNNDFLVEWPVGVIALVFYLLGFVPMWLVHRGVKWRLNRRIGSLETAAQTRVTTPATTPPPAPEPEPEPEPDTGELKSDDSTKL